MSYLEAVIMGIVQGATEFLPVSSSGHLAIFSKLFNLNEPDMTFDVLLHIGTLIAIIIAYYQDVKRLIIEGCGLIRDCCINGWLFVREKIRKEENSEYRRLVNSSYRKLVVLIIISTIPTAIIGLMMQEIVTVVKTNLLIVGVCLLLTACLLLISDFVVPGTKKPKNISYTNAFAIGICQGAATLPGISRSGTTITACLISGFDRRLAVKYSFLMSIPAVLGAAVLELKDFVRTISDCRTIGQYIVGTIIATIVGFVCIKVLNMLIKKDKFKYFAYYCIVIGFVSIILNFVL